MSSTDGTDAAENGANAGTLLAYSGPPPSPASPATPASHLGQSHRLAKAPRKSFSVRIDLHALSTALASGLHTALPEWVAGSRDPVGGSMQADELPPPVQMAQLPAPRHYATAPVWL